MIDTYIENRQYVQALELLTDLEDEQVRYQRLICLYGLEEYQQAKMEGMKAKILATDTYYDVVAIYVSILKELEEYEDAINIIVEELNMPYIPYEYETVFNAAYDELLLAKQEANAGSSLYHQVFKEEEIESLLLKDDVSEDLLYMAIDQLESMNIRYFVPAIRVFLKNKKKSGYIKSLLMDLMILQEIDEDMEVYKNGIVYDFNPSLSTHVLEQVAAIQIDQLLSDNIEDENPSLYLLCQQFLSLYLYTIYPRYIDEYDYGAIAGAIHYYLATLQYIDVDMADLTFLYHCDEDAIFSMLEEMEKMEA